LLNFSFFPSFRLHLRCWAHHVVPPLDMHGFFSSQNSSGPNFETNKSWWKTNTT
jgi:hypothetical protein